MASYKLHPLCEKFPEMPDEEFRALVEDMRVNGQREPIWVFGKLLLDGKHRLRACETLQLKPEVREFRTKHGPEEPQIKSFVLSRNFYRRHLTTGQRALIAAELVTTSGPGRPKLNGEYSPISIPEAAAAAAVDPKTVKQAAAIIESGSTALREAVESGEVSVSDAAKVVDLPKSEQNAAVKAVQSGESKTVAAAAREPGDDATEPEHDETISDAFGPVHKKVRKVFAELSAFRGIVNKIGRIQTEIEELQRSDAGAALPINEILKMLPQLQQAIKFAEPFCECPKCRRKPDDKCKSCEGLGWITEATWNRCKTKDDEQWLKSR